MTNQRFQSTDTEDFFDLLQSYRFDDLVDGLAKKFGSGWFPRDLHQLPDLGRAHKALLVDLISAHRRTWDLAASPIWVEHADHLGATKPWWNESADFWPQFLEYHSLNPLESVGAVRWWLGIFSVDRQLHQFAPPPWVSDSSSSADQDHQKVMGKIRGLLAKAESTQFPDEAEALSAKAQELISRHSIDVALLADSVEVPGGTRLYLDAPYTKPKFLLLAGIAEANRCRAVFNSGTDTATLIGFNTDVTLTEVLFTSLLVQGTSAILAAGPQQSRWDGASSTRSWRNSFWFGYADRIEERLSEAASEARYEAAVLNEGLLPVLASRSEAVVDTLEELFPNLRAMKVSVSNGAGLEAGRSFAEQADINKNTIGKRRRQLGA